MKIKVIGCIDCPLVTLQDKVVNCFATKSSILLSEFDNKKTMDDCPLLSSEVGFELTIVLQAS